MRNIHSRPPLGHHFQGSNVVPFRLGRRVQNVQMSEQQRPSDDAFDQLTSKLVMARHAQGQLEPELLRYLIAGVGLPL